MRLPPDCEVDDTSPLIVAQDAEQAIETMESLNIYDSNNEFTEYDRIQRVSTALLALSDTLISSPTTCIQDAYIRRALCSLLRVECLQRLFLLRQIFHAIAARDSQNGGTKYSIVCWVDIILSRLGDVVMAIVAQGANDLRYETATCNAFSKHKEEISLYAALQLPHNWADTLAVISSEFASPAASRLAVRLAFAAYVLQFKLAANDPTEEPVWPTTGPDPEYVLKYLRLYVHRNVRHDQSLREEACIGERTTYAMVLSLYAVSDTLRPTHVSCPLRPHTAATLLSFIGCVMGYEQTNTQNSSIYMTQEPDIAQWIVLRWSEVIPWMWTVWNDERIVDYNVIESTTQLWLSHINTYQSAADYEAQYLRSLARNLDAASYILSVLLNTMAIVYRGPSRPSESTILDTVYKCCWGTVRLLEVVRDHESPFVQSVTVSMAELFINLADEDKEVEAKDVILIGLAIVDERNLRTTICALSKASTYKLMLEDKTSAMIQRYGMSLGDISYVALKCDRIKSAIDAHIRLPSKVQKDLQQLLQFLTLSWHAGIDDIIHRKSASTLIAVIAVYFSQPVFDLFFSSDLAGQFITALALFETTKPEDSSEGYSTQEHMRLIQALASLAETTDILVTSAFASYTSAVIHQRSCDALSLAEAWDHLRDFLFLIHHRHFHGSDELLSILVCPTVCKAMLDILRHGDAELYEFIRTSPWSIGFCDALRSLVNAYGREDYCHARDACRTLSEEMSTMINSIKGRLRHTETPKSTPDKKASLRLAYAEDKEGISIFQVDCPT
ncbi:hypothetical protein NM688_g2967 [Phlebia brevispora]|uniref:Uncharacterized protein n=1 Tax=Phlebia brevispora TaxID=194682 RepID=A0ACC1T704_9APHY|nr:hypothetical protein NM688_g2967 [Phlebia brevispora]